MMKKMFLIRKIAVTAAVAVAVLAINGCKKEKAAGRQQAQGEIMY